MNSQKLGRAATTPVLFARKALACAGVLAVCGVLAAAPALGANVSTNWAGYVATPVAGGAPHFTSVSGTWSQPSATCDAGRASYSATWVGLGGYGESADALEQIGSDADCTRSGSASYSAWYELLPAGAVNLRLRVHPGDELDASVTVRSHGVTLRIRDLATGASFSTTKRASRLDTSSAEWIVEAPSTCVNGDTCAVLPLADFGEVAFSSATAIAGSHTGPVGDPDWSSSALELQQAAFGGFDRGTSADHLVPAATLVLATPSSPPSASGAFAVGWREQAAQPQQPSAPTLPGAGGGP